MLTLIAKFFIVGWLALGAMLSIATVGKPRKPLTPGTAAVSVALTAGLIVLIVLTWPTGGN